MSDSEGGTELRDDVLMEIRAVIIEWGQENYQEYPWRDPDREWHGLIAEILLQRTRAKNVVPVYREFTRRFTRPQDLAEASEEDILDVIGPLGLHWRASLLKQLGNVLVEEDQLPESLEALKELPGVGEYVASAYLSFHAGQRGVLIDSNIVRWASRMLGREYDGETRREEWVRKFLDRVTPENDHRQFNYALLDFTMSVCRPTSPMCEDCPIGATLCRHGEEKISA